jgi:hypothetical protein
MNNNVLIALGIASVLLVVIIIIVYKKEKYAPGYASMSASSSGGGLGSLGGSASYAPISMSASSGGSASYAPISTYPPGYAPISMSASSSGNMLGSLGGSASYAPISTFLPAVPGGGIGPFIVYGADVQTGPIALVTKNEMAAFLSIIPLDFQFRSLTTRQQIEDAMLSPDIILPQDIPYLTTNQVKNLTDAQILSIQMGYFILFSKVNFTVDQLAALTPEEMKSNVPKSSQIAWTAGVILQLLPMLSGKFSQEQEVALDNIMTNCP